MFSELIGALSVSKSIGIAYSWKEIYVSNLQQVFSETCLEDADLSKPQPCKYFVVYGLRKSRPRLNSELRKQQ